MCVCVCVCAGYGESKGAVKDPVAFLEEVLSLLKLHDPVIVSPSMSGKFSLPFLMEYPEKVKGFIPVAPVGTGTFVDKYPSVKVRYGSVSLLERRPHFRGWYVQAQWSWDLKMCPY